MADLHWKIITAILWFVHRYIQPIVLKFGNPWAKKMDAITEANSQDKAVNQDSPEYKFIQHYIKEHPVMMFSKSYCPYCNMGKRCLDEAGVAYHVIEIDGREDCSRLQDLFLKLTGERTVPRIYIGGKCIGGGTEVFTLHNQNKLIPMVEEAGGQIKKVD